MIARITRRSRKKRIVILGGGFAGVYAAIHLEKLLARERTVEICLVSRDNFFLFTPMLHEIAASDLEITNIWLRRLLKKFCAARNQVLFSMYTDFENFSVFKPDSHKEESVNAMLDELIAWGGALKSLRNS